MKRTAIKAGAVEADEGGVVCCIRGTAVCVSNFNAIGELERVLRVSLHMFSR